MDPGPEHSPVSPAKNPWLPALLLFLAALEKVLLDQGLRLPAGAGVAAAIRSYQQAGQNAVVGARK